MIIINKARNHGYLHKKSKIEDDIVDFLFAGAVFLVIYETLLLRTENPQEPKLELFWSYREWLANGNDRLGKQIMLNILLFIPYGVILWLLARPGTAIFSATV